MENDANVNDHKLTHIKSGHLKGDDVNMNRENTVVKRMKRRSEDGLDEGMDIHTWYCRDMGRNILQGLTMMMMISIEHRSVPQNNPVTSKRPLLGIVRLQLAMRMA